MLSLVRIAAFPLMLTASPLPSTWPFAGPKGVINDWRRFKQLETEQREEQCREMERLIKTLSMTCRSHLDEEEDKRKQKTLEEKLNGKVTLLGTVSGSLC